MKQSRLLTCDICGKEIFARGLKAHVRLQHTLNLTPHVKEENIEYDGPPEFKPATYEELKESVNFYYHILGDEKTILKFIAWINEKELMPDLPNILKDFCAFILYGGKTEDEVNAED